jgi:hypothetical protein
VDLQTIIAAARAVGPVLGALPAVRDLIDGAVAGLSETDQATAKATLAELRDGNDALHGRLSAKLAEAARR